MPGLKRRNASQLPAPQRFAKTRTAVARTGQFINAAKDKALRSDELVRTIIGARVVVVPILHAPVRLIGTS